MKLLSCLIFLASLSVTAFSQAGSKLPVKDQLLPLLAEQMLAARGHDVDRFLATYVHSQDLIFVENGKIIRGWDSLRGQQLKWWRNGKSDVVYSIKRGIGPTMASSTQFVDRSKVPANCHQRNLMIVAENRVVFACLLNRVEPVARLLAANHG